MPNQSSSSTTDLKLLQAFWQEPVERSVLPNGLTVILKCDRSAALASVQVWVKTGSVHESAHLGAGLSHYLEHMLFKGTGRRAGREISATVQAHGGYINAYTTFDRTVYYIDLPSEHTGLAIDVLADAVLNSTLPADEVALEREVILREIAMTRDDPDNRLWEALFSTAFREHPYRQPIIGHADVFSAVTRDDLLAYYRSRYAPNNLVVVVVGDIDVAATRTVIEAHFGQVPRVRLAPVLVPAEPPQLAPRSEHRFEDVEITRSVLAWPIPGLSHADAPVLDLLATLLGHGDSSVLWQEVRERSRLVHTIDASSWNPGTNGLFCITFTGEPEKRLAATARIQQILARCASAGFKSGDLKKALRQLVVGEINSRKTMSGQAARLGVAEVVVGDLDHSRTYFEQLRAVTPAAVRAVLRRYLVAERLTAVSLNPAAVAAENPASCVRPVSGIPDFSETRLANGTRLLLQPEHRLPNVHLRLLMTGGPLFEEPGRRGATALLATMLTKDTRRRSAAAVARFIEEVGGAFYPFSGNNSLGLAAEVLPIDVDRALGVLADAVLCPNFKPETLATEREAQLASLRQDDDDVVTLARKHLRQRFFGLHPLGLDAQGDIAGVSALTAGELLALHRRLCVGSNVVLAVAGDFEPRELAPRLKAFLNRIPRGGIVSPRLAVAGQLPAERGDFIEQQPREQAVVLQAFTGPRVHGEDFYVGEVADELFSGMASRLFERVREEKGLAYFVRSSRVMGLDAGMFYFMAGTQPGKEAEVLGEIEAEIARVRSGAVEPAELSRCQARLKAARRQSLQTNSSRAMQAGLNALQGQPINDWKNYDARIDAVTIGDLVVFAEHHFDRERRTQLVVRP